MKKMFLRGISLILCLILLAVPVFAEGGSATLSSASGAPGDTVTMTVTLKDMPAGDAMGFVVSGLTPSGGSWSKNALLSNIDSTTGVWANDAATDLNGEILKLNFTVPAETTTVSVRVKVLSGEEVVYDKTVSNTITVLIPATGLTLNVINSTLTLGSTETLSLQAILTPDNSTDSVSWSTSDASVATVSGGTVTAVKPGTATITATAGSISATCNVTVTCAHANLTEVAAKAATCTATGNHLHYTCKKCGKQYKKSIPIIITENSGTFNIKKPVVKSVKGDTATITLGSKTKVDGYQIYKYNGEKWVKVKNTQKDTVTLDGLKSGRTYKFRVRAYKLSGKAISAVSHFEKFEVATSPDSTFIRAIGRPSDTSAIVSWAEADGANGYIVYAATSKKGKYEKVAEVKGQETKCTVSGLKKNKQYFFKVQAIRTSQNNTAYSEMSK